VRILLRRALGFLLILAALAVLGSKLWLEYDGPYLEALEPYPFCQEAQTALDEDRIPDALELAEAADCPEQLATARSRWNELSAVFQRCVDGVWTGRGEDGAGITCAIASDLIVFGDVRDLTRQGVAWMRGEETDMLLVALSATGLVLTFAPQLGAGASLLKGARRAGAVSESLAKSTAKLVQQRAWRPLANVLTDAGRISTKLGPAKATRILQYADDADEVAALAKFAERAPTPLLGLKWGGKGAARMSDDVLYREALKRGPEGVQLAMQRGGKALLARQPLVVFAAKTIYKNPEAVLAAILAIVTFLLRWFDWQFVLLLVLALTLVGAFLNRPRSRRRSLRYRSA